MRSTTRKVARRKVRQSRLSAPLPPNAAELWAATLPRVSEIAIATERARRDSRPVAPLVCQDSHPDRVRPESERGWALASLALMVLVVVLACCAAGVRFH